MAKLRILHPKLYRCPNTDPLHIGLDRPTEDGRFEIQQTCANHILIKVLILMHMVILCSLLSSCRAVKCADTVIKASVKDPSPSRSMPNNFFVFAHCSYAKLGHVI